MRGRKTARLIALALALMTLVSLTACNRETEPEKVKLTNVFSFDPIPLPDGVQYIDRAAVSGDHIYFIGSGYNEATQVSVNGLFVMKTDGSESQMLVNMENTHDNNDPEDKIYYSRYVQNMVVDPDGNLCYCEVESIDDYSDPENPVWERNTLIKKTTTDGTVLFEIKLKDLVPQMEYPYVSAMVFGGDGSLCIGLENTLLFLDKDTGKVAFKLEDTNYINSVVSTGKGDLYVSGWADQGGIVLRPIDMAAKAWGEPVEVENNNMYQLLPGSGEYDFYYQDNIAVYGYKLETQESIEVLNWINSDINSNQMNTVVPLADGRIMGVQWPEQEGDPSLVMMTPRNPDDIPESIIITYATMWMGSDIRSAIIKFNRSQEEYRIQVLDYYQYSTNDNWMAGYEKLSADIISGNVPDIINLDGLNIDNFVNKGLLADLYPFIDNDPELSRDMLLQNVLDAASRDGKLYQAIPSFSIFTVVGKTSLVGSEPGWTMEQLQQLMSTMPEGTVAFSEMTRGNILSYSTMMAMDQFIDTETGKCNFESADFAKLLEFASGFDEEIDWEALYGEDYDWEYHQSAFKDNRTLLMPCNVYDLRDIRNYQEQFGEPITFIGFPTANKNGTCIMPNMQVAMSAKSKNQDAAWQFIRSFLVDEYYSDSNRYYYGLPLNRNVLESKITLEKTPLADRPEGQDMGYGRVYTSYAGGGAVAISEGYGNNNSEDEYYKNYHLTDAEVDQIMSIITSANTLMFNDQEISQILNDEVAYYFDGSKTAAETATVIQNKIQTYINESR